MKKQALKAVTMLVSIIALAFMTALVSNAQSRSQQLRAHIPFDFTVGDKTLPAGEYIVATVTSNSDDAIVVRSRDGKESAMSLTHSVQARSRNERLNGKLTFYRGDVDKIYYLKDIWRSGAAEGRQLLSSKAQRAAERRLSRIASNKNSAGSAQPEIVTIYAELQ
jgi:hypothetical protein